MLVPDERVYFIARFEFRDTGADCYDNASEVVADFPGESGLKSIPIIAGMNGKVGTCFDFARSFPLLLFISN